MISNRRPTYPNDAEFAQNGEMRANRSETIYWKYPYFIAEANTLFYEMPN